MFKTQYNFCFDPVQHSEPKSELPSLTVPDMSYTVRELIEKFTTGGMPPIQHEGTYDENLDFSDALAIDQDLTDLHQARLNVDSLNEKLRKLEKSRIEAEKAQNVEAQRELKELKKRLETLDNREEKRPDNYQKRPSNKEQKLENSNYNYQDEALLRRKIAKSE